MSTSASTENHTRFDWGLYSRWVSANALGELIGLGLTFVVGFGSVTLVGEPQSKIVAAGLGLVMAASGAIEGVIVGAAQWWAMQKALPEIQRKSWIAATVIGALVAWTFGAIPTTMMSTSTEAAPTAVEPETGMLLLMAGGMGALLGIVLALAQWIVLRRSVPNAWWWLPANSAAWLLGMPVVFAAVDLAQRAGGVWQAVLIFAAALLLTGAVVGAVHGLALVKLVPQERS